MFSNCLTQVGFPFDVHCIVRQICHTVEHILLQYHRVEVFCVSLLLYSISYIADLAGFLLL